MPNVGDFVTVGPPFDETYPGVWEVEAVNKETGAFQIAGGVDFAEEHIDIAKAPVTREVPDMVEVKQDGSVLIEGKPALYSRDMLVTLRYPFDKTYPGVWKVEAINPKTGSYQIAGGVDFAAENIIAAKDSVVKR